MEVDIPATEVLRALQQLSAQTGLQLIYSSGSLAGARTKAVQGTYLPSQILKTLLEGTPFVAVPDHETGAFAIIRSPDQQISQLSGDGRPENQARTTNQTGMKQNTDRNRNLLNSFFKGVLGLALAGSTPLSAQETEEEIYVLTPFEISEGEDEGYIATSTLAGTRMRMSLNDVGSSISVFTEELMEDIAAVDNETLLAYGLGTEVGGARGNFINPNSEGLENENLVDPQSNNRIRGLTSADTTRNFFKSDVPWDGYNTYRIDIQRGANSILFGLGSPAGIINNTTRNANFFNHNRLQVTLDKFTSGRIVGNFNRVLIEDQLAVRLDYLNDDKKFRQDPAFEKDKRYHLALTWQPEGWNTDETTTRFTASFEDGKVRANRPRMVVPLDMVSSYFRPASENGFQGADFANGGVWGPPSDIHSPGGRIFDWVADEEILSQTPWVRGTINSNPWTIFAFDATNPGRGFTAAQQEISSVGSFFQAEGSRDTAGQTAIVVNDGAYVNPVAASNRPQDVFVRGAQNNIFGYRRIETVGKQRVANDNRVAFAGFWRDPSLSSTDQFDYVNNLIDGNNKLEQQNFDVLELQWRNTFLNDRLGFQLSYFSQNLDFRQDANLGAIFAPAIQVEANLYDSLSDDMNNPQPNPTAGRAFVDFELRLRGGIEDIRNREAQQAQVFGLLNFSDFMDPDNWFTRLLGRHNFTGLAKNRQLERFRREFNSTGVDEQTIRQFGRSLPDDPGLNPRYNAQNSDPGPGARMGRLDNAFGNVQPRIRVYLDAQGPNLTQLQPFADPIVPSGSYQIRAFNAIPNPGFDAVAAAEPWITPRGDETVQADNPANYQGTGVKGPFTIVKATDSEEALDYLTQRRFYDFEDVDSTALVWSGSFLNDLVAGMYGWREDEVVQRGLEHDYSRIVDQNAIGRTGGPNFDPNSSFVRVTEGSFQSRNWSIRLNASQLFEDFLGFDNLPLNVALLYNEGEVQTPQPGRRDVLLNDLTPATGRTTDTSIAISTKDNRYTLRITEYDTVSSNANAGSVAASENWRIEQVLREGIRNGVVQIEQRTTGWADAVLDNGDDVDDPGELSEARSNEIRTAGFDDVQAWGDSIAGAFRGMQEELFSRWPASQSWITGGAPGTDFINVNFPDDTVFIEDNESFGTEIEFVARPTDNWNIAINASKTEVLRSKVFGDEVNEVLDFIVGELAGPAGQVPLWGPEGQMGQARVAPFLGQLITNRALLGTPTGELRKWKYNMITNYDFTEGALAGFGAGAGYRWEDSQVIGFQPIYIDPVTGETLPDATRPDRALSVDLNTPYEDSTRDWVDFWLTYRTKLTDKIDWRIQLNIFNLFDDKGTVPLFINPDGTYGTLGIREGRSWQITNTFEF